MGIYTDIKNKLLYPILEVICNDETENMSEEGREYADEMMKAIWYSELYRMIFKQSGGFYHSIFEKALERCQMILLKHKMVPVIISIHQTTLPSNINLL